MIDFVTGFIDSISRGDLFLPRKGGTLFFCALMLLFLLSVIPWWGAAIVHRLCNLTILVVVMCCLSFVIILSMLTPWNAKGSDKKTYALNSHYSIMISLFLVPMEVWLLSKTRWWGTPVAGLDSYIVAAAFVLAYCIYLPLYALVSYSEEDNDEDDDSFDPMAS